MDNPNYYAILPANVRYDKNLKPMEKILYAEITALSNKNGYCSASNSYFAKLYEKSERVVRSWISNLAKNGYVKVIINEKNNSRRIYITYPSNREEENFQGVGKKVPHNNINKILQEDNINKKTNKEISEKFSIQTALQKSDIQQLLNELQVDENFLYELDNHRKSINKPIVNIKALIATLKDIREASILTKRSANEILTIMEEQGWKSVKAKWINNLEGKRKGKKKKDKEFDRKELEKFGFKFDDNEVIETNLIEGDIYGQNLFYQKST